MTEEKTISGYCRQTDQPRMVLLEYDTQSRQLLDVDCMFCNCIYAPSCNIGIEIAKTTTP